MMQTTYMGRPCATRSLIYSDVEFVKESDFDSAYQKAISISADEDISYILEVDIEALDGNLHDKHSWLPFCPINKVPPWGKYSKLILDFSKKENYTIHYTSLQQILKNGLKANNSQ